MMNCHAQAHSVENAAAIIYFQLLLLLLGAIELSRSGCGIGGNAMAAGAAVMEYELLSWPVVYSRWPRRYTCLSMSQIRLHVVASAVLSNYAERA